MSTSLGNRSFATVAAAVSSVAVLAVVIGARTAPQVAKTVRRPTVQEWQLDNFHGIREGPVDAPVVVTEFVDFECDSCPNNAAALDTLLRENPDVALVVLHVPQTERPLSVQAARAAECAATQDAFYKMYRTLRSSETQLAGRTWEEVAKDAEIRDVAQFAQCMGYPADSFPRIEDGLMIARKRGVSSRGALFVNGEIVVQPNLEKMRSAVKRAR